MQFSSLGRCVGAMALLAMISFSSSYAQAQNSALERAMRAALRGPEAKRIKIRGHQFNVKPIRRTRTRNGVIVKGQISHHLNLRKDDQVYYTIHKRGNVIENIDIRIRRGGITGTLGLGFVQSGLSRIFRGLPLPPNPLQAVGRRLESLLDGS